MDNGPRNKIEEVLDYLNKNQCYPSQFVVSLFPAALSLFPIILKYGGNMFVASYPFFHHLTYFLKQKSD